MRHLRYAIFDFATNERTEEMPRIVACREVDRDTQCVVCQAVTVEAERNLGECWQCDHVLPPRECIHCNPEHRDAYTSHCPVCHPEPCSMAQTWHNAAGECLKCKESSHDSSR